MVVTNPTELAIAIQYDPETMKAPIVVAKGAGVLAQQIRRLALEHGIPIVEKKPLAQTLYRDVDINKADSRPVIRGRRRSAGLRLPAEGQEAGDVRGGRQECLMTNAE